MGDFVARSVGPEGLIPPGAGAELVPSTHSPQLWGTQHRSTQDLQLLSPEREDESKTAGFRK